MSRIVKPNVAGCNIFRGGEQFRFAMNLDAKYGEGRAEELLVFSKNNFKI
jgi:hypothetical protein